MYLSLGSNQSVPGFVPPGLPSGSNIDGGSSDGTPLGQPVQLTETVLGSLSNGAGPGTGNLSVNPAVPSNTFAISATGVPGPLGSGVNPIAASQADNGLAISVDASSIAGLMGIMMGNGGLNAFESLRLSGVTSADPTILIGSNAGDTVNINLADVAATDAAGGLLIKDTGHGVDIVNMLNITVAARLTVTLGDSGANDLSAENVTAALAQQRAVPLGFIYGGAGAGNHYHDNGGNSGFLWFGLA